MPVLNFLHETGHWEAYKLHRVPVKMRLQNVQVIGDREVVGFANFSSQWAGPLVNYAVIAAGWHFPPMRICALSMALHRIGPQVVGVALYSKGNTRFTSDETILFVEKTRLVVASIFLLLYGFLSARLCGLLGMTSWPAIAGVIASGSIAWIAYGALLHGLDGILFR